MRSWNALASIILLVASAPLAGCVSRGVISDHALKPSEQDMGFVLMAGDTRYAPGSGSFMGMDLPAPGLELQYKPAGGSMWNHSVRLDDKYPLLLQKVASGEYDLRLRDFWVSLNVPLGTFRIEPGAIVYLGHFRGTLTIDRSGVLPLTRGTLEITDDQSADEAALRAKAPAIAYPIRNQARQGVVVLRY